MVAPKKEFRNAFTRHDVDLDFHLRKICGGHRIQVLVATLEIVVIAVISFGHDAKARISGRSEQWAMVGTNNIATGSTLNALLKLRAFAARTCLGAFAKVG